jgi:hypothetical protein
MNLSEDDAMYDAEYPDFPGGPRAMAARLTQRSRERRAIHDGDPHLKKATKQAAVNLAVLNDKSPPQDLFVALKRLGARFDGALLEFISETAPQAPADVVYDIPPVFLCKVAALMDTDPVGRIMLLLDAGTAGRDVDMADPDVLREAEITRTLYPDFGFSWVMGLCVADAKSPDGCVALFLFGKTGCEPLSDIELIALERMSASIRDAIQRMCLPRGLRHPALKDHVLTLNSVPSLAPYVLQDGDGKIVEITYHALQIANAYLSPGSSEEHTNPFDVLTAEPLKATATAEAGAHTPSSWRERYHYDRPGEVKARWRRVATDECAVSADGSEGVLILLSHRMDRVLSWLASPAAFSDKKHQGDWPRPDRVYFLYAAVDAGHYRALDSHMASLRLAGSTVHWHSGAVLPGDDYVGEVTRHLAESDLVLVLVSADVLDSDACMKELSQAMDLSQRGFPRVIPILVRACGFRDLPLAKLAAVPANGKPVTDRQHWQDSDHAWKEVVEAIRRVLKQRYDQ